MHQYSKRFNFGHLAIAFVTGALAAVAATLISTPITGRESREHLRRFARRSKDALASAPDVIRRGFRRGKQQMEGYIEE